MAELFSQVGKGEGYIRLFVGSADIYLICMTSFKGNHREFDLSAATDQQFLAWAIESIYGIEENVIISKDNVW